MAIPERNAMISNEDIQRAPVEFPGPRGFVCIGYTVIDPRSGDTLRPTDAMGAEGGKWVAGLFDAAVEGLAEVPTRCATCAFRRGTIANTSATSVAAALDCLLDDSEPFGCHHGLDHFPHGNAGPCVGYATISKSRVGAWLRLMHATGVIPKSPQEPTS
jgi:hypothetical protein